MLPYPSVNMTFKAGRCRIAGVLRGRFSETLEGAGRVFGVRFRPGGFRTFLNGPVSSITDRFVAVDKVFGPPGHALSDAVLAADDLAASIIMNSFLTQRIPDEPDSAAELVADLVTRIADDRGVWRVDTLAHEYNISIRQLQRMFADYVGVGPKWVIRRYRLHEAAARTNEGTHLDLADLAEELGYSDQAHLTRDFTAIVGEPPGRYIKAQ